MEGSKQRCTIGDQDFGQSVVPMLVGSGLPALVAQKLMSKANAWVAKSQRDLCRIMTSSYSTAILISGSGSSFVVPSPFLCQKGLGLQSGRRSNRAKSSDPGPPKASKLHEQPARERERERERERLCSYRMQEKRKEQQGLREPKVVIFCLDWSASMKSNDTRRGQKRLFHPKNTGLSGFSVVAAM